MGEMIVYGSDMSPYSLKVHSYLKYKGIPHQWLNSNKHPAEYKKAAKLPIVPAVVYPDGKSAQDSTPIIEKVEAEQPQRSIHPPGVLKFLSYLVEEFGDEWGNKWMFHYRWAREVDQASAARRIAGLMAPNEKAAKSMAGMIQKRMAGRGVVIGSNPTTAPLIEADFKAGILALDRHLATRPYIFGGRPSFGDFGLGHQINQALTDPTCGQIIRETAPNVRRYCERILNPNIEGDWETWEVLEPTLGPFFRDHVANFLRWSSANATALSQKEKTMTVELLPPLGKWTQTVGGPQKYHAKSLKVLRQRYTAYAGDEALRRVLSTTGCLAPLSAASKL